MRDPSSAARGSRQHADWTRTEIDQLLSSHGADAAVTVHAEDAGKLRRTPAGRSNQALVSGP